jgi:periplasmic divalent cation tolerance protein
VIGGLALSEFVVVLCTVPVGRSESMARALVEERLAACVNVSQVRSYFVWEGKFSTEQEELMTIKTEQGMVEALKKRILDLHSYQVPEIIVIPVKEGYEPYFNWIDQSVG